MNFSIGCMRAPPEIIFGAGQRHALGKMAKNLGCRALLCTDARLGGSAELHELQSSLANAGVDCQVFADTEPELPLENILACRAEFAAYRPDLIIGLGGGSCMDLAKLVALLLAHGGELGDYAGEFKVPGPICPLIALPTTAGTGSEVTPVAVYGDKRVELKIGISSPRLIPQLAICDPELTQTCPPGLTAVAGADALTHAIEAFTAKRRPPTAGISGERVFIGKNAFSDQAALSAITAISGSLEAAVADGSDREARAQLMLGATLAGLAFGTAGTAAAHAIQYPLGAATGTAHGAGVAALLPYVMDFNRPACQDEFAAIARIFGATPAHSIDSPADKAIAAAEAVRQVRALFNTIGIPRSLADMGLAEDRRDWVVDQAMQIERLLLNNPRPLQRDDVAGIVDAAFYGRNLPQ